MEALVIVLAMGAAAAASIWIMPDALRAIAVRLLARAHAIEVGRQAMRTALKEYAEDLER